MLRNDLDDSAKINNMTDRYEEVHVHKMDVRSTTEQYRKKGYRLQEQTKATIAAQKGFVKLIFVKSDSADKQA